MWCFLFVNMVFGLIMFIISASLSIEYDKHISVIFAVIGVFMGIFVWIPYGVYKIIKCLIKKSHQQKQKRQQEISKVRNNVLNLCKYEEYYKITSDLRLQFNLKQCSQLYLKLQSYKEINLLHNNRVDKVFISTLNYLLEVNKQYENYDEEIEQKKKEIIDKLLKFLITENEIYEKEYQDMKNKDKHIIKNQLDKFSNTIDAYMEFEEIGRED